MESLLFSKPQKLQLYQLAKSWHGELTGAEFMEVVHLLAKAMSTNELKYSFVDTWVKNGCVVQCDEHDKKRAIETLKEFSGPCITFDEPVLTYRTPFSEILSGRPSPLFTKTLSERLCHVLIDRDDFRGWLESIVHPLPRFWFPEKENQREDIFSKTAEQLVQREREAGHIGKKRPTLEHIVRVIDAELTGPLRLTNEEIGALFPNAENETKDAKEQRGKRLRGKKT